MIYHANRCGKQVRVHSFNLGGKQVRAHPFNLRGVVKAILVHIKQYTCIVYYVLHLSARGRNSFSVKLARRKNISL